MKRKIKDIFKDNEHLLKGTESVLTDEILNTEIEESLFLQFTQFAKQKPEKPTKVEWDKQSEKLWKDFDEFCKKKLLGGQENWSVAADVAMNYACQQAIVENHENPMIIEEQMQWSIDFVKSAISDGYVFKKL